jgi:hypothetical protein
VLEPPEPEPELVVVALGGNTCDSNDSSRPPRRSVTLTTSKSTVIDKHGCRVTERQSAEPSTS